MLRSIKVKDIMSSMPCVTDTGSTVQKIAEIMKTNHVASVVIVENDEPKGIITERDIVQRVVAPARDPKKLKASEIMTKPVIAVIEDTAVDEAIMIMRDNRIRRLVVVGDDDKVSGVITIDDIGYTIGRSDEQIGPNFVIALRRIRQDT